jgi:UDP-N-acetylmuramoyl-L-alanyl-D-glutamate--2,6-diaminopimelate ligase
MKLQHLFAVFPGLPEEKLSTLEVSGLFQDARQVTPGSVFIAVRGGKFDGHDFLPDATQKGAAALVVQDKSKVPADFGGFVLQVPDTRHALDILASRFYWDPSNEMFCAGVTGTNGKTSTTYMIEALLNGGGHKTAVMGTVNHHLGTHVWPSDMTTPEPIALQNRLREFRNRGATAVAMEVSSHALHQKRVESVSFNAAVFTNLTRDHLDYHGNMNEYFDSKQRLFTDLLWHTMKNPSYAVVNIADSAGRKLRVAQPAEIITYGPKEADLTYQILETDFTFTRFLLKTRWSKDEIKLPLCGTHNVQNALAALGVGIAAQVKWKILLQALEKFEGVPGRLQTVPGYSRHVLVDYAHTPDALENVLTALQKVRGQKKSKNKISVIFGCGGDRDRGKRPLMAKIAKKYADKVVITSDNPRTENPQDIINDILQGISASDRSQVTVLPDREQAIRETISTSQPDDVILIAGKGHEDYQVIGREKRPFSDFDIAKRVLQGMG